MPNIDWNNGSTPEPFTEYFGVNHPDPDNFNFGPGGASQSITNTEIKDYTLQVFPNNIMSIDQ